jgi:hypothetical protein
MSLSVIRLDLCPDGTEHEPVVETEELATDFWGHPSTTIKVPQLTSGKEPGSPRPGGSGEIRDAIRATSIGVPGVS